MYAAQAFSLLRLDRPASVVAKNFAAFCGSKGASSSGVRVGKTSRGLRGIISTRELKPRTTVLSLPLASSLSVGTAVRDSMFMSELDADIAALAFRKGFFAERIGVSPIRFDQYLLALYLGHIVLTEGHEFRSYTDFLPRAEGAFGALHQKLEQHLNACTFAMQHEEWMAARRGVTQSEMRQLLLWALSMVFSRQVILSDHAAVGHVLQGSGVPVVSGCTTSVLPPLIDLLNHSVEDNVELLCRASDSNLDAVSPIVMILDVVTTTQVPSGAELCIHYSSSFDQLRLMWGMSKELL